MGEETRRAVDEVVTELEQQGYRFETVAEFAARGADGESGIWNLGSQGILASENLGIWRSR